MVKLKKYAWAGSNTFAEPTSSIALAKDIGLDGLDLVLNDFTANRSVVDFKMRPIAQVLDMAGRIVSAGLECHLMTFVMPHDRFVAGMCHQLGVLLNTEPLPPIGALQFDLEEAWTKATGTFDYSRAGRRIHEDLILPVKLARGHRPIPAAPGTPDLVLAGPTIEQAMEGVVLDPIEVPPRGVFRFGVNGIGYASTSKLDPVASVCDFLCPQLYVPMSGLSAADLRKMCERWRREIGENSLGLARASALPIMVGLAGSARAAHDAQACLNEIRMLPDWFTGEVIYWNLHLIGKSKPMQAIIRAA